MLQFPYRDEPLRGSPPPSLPNTATVRWRPLVPVTLIGPSGMQRSFPRAVLDPGGDDTVFPIAAAAALGIVLRSPSGHGLRWRGQAYPIRFGDAELELDDGKAVCHWPTIVGFSSAALRYPILGICGFLQFFDARFLGADLLVQLETNRTYPGTTS